MPLIIKTEKIDVTKLDLSIKELVNRDMPLLCEFLEANPNITELDLSHNYIGPEGVRALVENTTLRRLNLSYNYIGNEGAKLLAQRGKIRLHTLVLRECGITDVGAEALAKSPTLIELDLNHNLISDDAVQVLAHNKVLEALSLKNVGLGDVSATLLAQDTNNIRWLDVTDNPNITGKGKQDLKNKTSLEYLYFGSAPSMNQVPKEYILFRG